jgi:hypothetical protein
MDEDKGQWAEVAEEGIAPTTPDDAAVTGETTGDDSPATSEGIDKTAGDNADATRDGGGDSDSGDLKDAAQP